jgi:hypothetical protein
MPSYTVSGTAYEFPGCVGYMRGWIVVLDPLGWEMQTSLGDGSFAFHDVPNGSYSVRMSPPCNPSGCWSDVPVTVAGGDVQHVQTCPNGPVVTPTATVGDPAVGGIAEPPDEMNAAHGGGGLPIGEIAMLAGVAVVAATAGGWYARRRFGRQRR